MSFLSFYVIPKPSRVYFALKIFQNQLENVVFEGKCIFSIQISIIEHVQILRYLFLDEINRWNVVGCQPNYILI